ncbi:MAG: hypothetical protein ACFBSG_02475 [Leptolyngbyaceae cyanobacterium]
MINSDWITVNGLVKPGHQIASGKSENSPYEKGSLEIQLPYFQKLGLDLKEFYLGTINVSITPYTCELVRPKFTFELVKWHADYPAETFSFSPCIVAHHDKSFQGLVYYPHPETKIGHFQDSSIIEVIAPLFSGMEYGDRLTLQLNPQEIRLIKNEHKANAPSSF